LKTSLENEQLTQLRDWLLPQLMNGQVAMGREPVTKQDLSKAKKPDLRASLAAMQRAAEQARKIAIRTDTALVVVRDGKLMRIPADELRAEHEARNRAER
jgi:hypothetical protein